MIISTKLVELQLSGIEQNELAKRTTLVNIFDYTYENMQSKGNYQQKYQTKNRKITSQRLDLHLPDNSIQTAKYTLINFVPKQLFLQFSKLANLYFLIIGIMQIIPQVSISNSVPVIFLPLSFIIFVSAMKDLYEDYKRHISDQEENNNQVLTLKNGKLVATAWQDLRVGNIIKIEQDKQIPADILLLKSHESKGLCYFETKSLDGETNLKMKNVSTDLLKLYKTDEDLSHPDKQIILKYEAPNPYLYRFYGLTLDGHGMNSAITFNNFVLRGCILRNVRYVLGLVAYTGHDTKIMLNSFKARSKKSKLEILMQSQIFYIFGTQMIICTSCAIYYVVWYNQHLHNLGYLNIDRTIVTDNSPVYNLFVRLGNWVLIFTNFVPISLLVTLEMVKFIQGIFISKDKEMKAPSVQSSNLNEELGQIEYVFSDKTGTLTCNVMEFKQITIGTQSYGKISPESEKYINNEEIKQFAKVSNVDFRDKSLFDSLKNQNDPNHQKVKDCLFLLATCHTIITDVKEKEIIYNASSPDELALVNFAKFCGVEYMGTDEFNMISVKFEEKIYEYELIEVFEFTSTRKRQSVLVRIVHLNEIWLFTKGADSVLLDPIRLNQKEQSSQSSREKLLIMNKNLLAYGEEGLRTLVLCQRQIEKTDFDKWMQQYQKAQTQLEGRAEKMQDLQDKLETNFTIIGSTAIEDKLQNGVGETIDAIKKAGIKVWVLTGDKIETAINIGYSCKLLNSKMKQHHIDEKEESMIRKALNDIISDLHIVNSNNQARGVARPAQYTGFQALSNGAANALYLNCASDVYQNDLQHALIISGDALFHALKPGISGLVMQIAEQCQAVLCCRVSPKQKQDVVSLVRKEKPNVQTLAIGDGANDVNMITAAHVGIGIRGVEGQQAARASDYAICEFQVLRRLLFYHGRESYRRNSCLVCYNFFKNVLLVLPQFFFGALSVFSAQSLYDSFLYQLFNILFASMPIIIYAVFDEQYRPSTLVENKQNFYAQGMQNLLFNTKLFWLWVANGVWQASVICYFASYILGDSFVSSRGYTSHFWANGTMVYGLVVLVSNFKVVIFSNTFTIITFLGIFLSLCSYLISWLIVDKIASSEAYMVLSQLWKTPNFHFGNIVTIGATTFLDLAIELYIRWRTPLIASSITRSIEQVYIKKQDSLKGNFMQSSKNQTLARGHLQRNLTSHTGFAFCALEREPDNVKYREEQQF